MAVIRKSELKTMGPEERVKKIAELEKAMLELRGEGRKDKTKPLRKAIAKLKTPPAQGFKTSESK
jgi:ribosomal protein L29